MFILHDYALLDTLLGVYNLFLFLLSEAWILKTLGFVIFAGSIMALIEKSGGVAGFVDYVLHKRSFVKSERSALMVSYILGVVTFLFIYFILPTYIKLKYTSKSERGEM